MAGIDSRLAEDSVIGSVLISPETAGTVISALRAEDFDSVPARVMFQAISRLFAQAAAIDPVTALREARDEVEGLRAYVLQVMETTPTAANVGLYVEAVQEAARLRRIRGLAPVISGAVTLEDARGALATLEAEVAGRPEVRSRTMEQGLVDFYSTMERKAQYIQWGLPFLDDKSNGLTAEPGDYIVLGGYPSDGKTALALSFAILQAKTRRVGFFSLETSSGKLISRIVAASSGVSGAKIRHRDLSPEDWEKIAAAGETLSGRKLEIVEAAGMRVEDIIAHAKAREFEIVFIDYLSLIAEAGKSEYEQVTTTTKKLHIAAQRHKMTIVALSQLNRANGKSRPTLDSLRASGQIEQDADVIMFLYRKEDEGPARRVLSVAKNKEGSTGQVLLKFDGERMTFAEDTRAQIKQFANSAKKNTKAQAYSQIELTEISENGPIPF